MPRDDFSIEVKRNLKDRVAAHCSNPDCDVLTIGASDESNNSINNIGVAAHICAAASGKGARRYKASMTSEQRSAIENGIWLCAKCATMIDRDEISFTEELLQQWKAQAEERAKSRHGKKLYDQKEIEAIVQSLMAKHHLDNQTKNEQIKGLTVAVTALSQKGELGTAAIEAFQQNNLSLAKDLFKLETQRAEMAAKQGAEAYRNLGAIAFLDNTQEALNAYRRATELDSDNLVGWNQLGILLHRIGDLESAIIVFEKILELGKTSNNKQIIALAYCNLGVQYQIIGELNKSLKFFLKSLRINTAIKNEHGIAIDYANLSIIYGRRGEIEKSEELQLKSIEINKRLNNEIRVAQNYINFGNLFQIIGKFDKSIEVYQMALEILEVLGIKENLAQVYTNLGLAYEECGILDKAIEYHSKSLKISYDLNYKEGIAIVYNNLGITYKEYGDFNKAIELYEKSLETTLRTILPSHSPEVTKLLIS